MKVLSAVGLKPLSFISTGDLAAQRCQIRDEHYPTSWLLKMGLIWQKLIRQAQVC